MESTEDLIFEIGGNVGAIGSSDLQGVVSLVMTGEAEPLHLGRTLDSFEQQTGRKAKTVSRSLARATTNIWESGNKKILRQVYSDHLPADCPTPKNFIMRLAEYLKRQPIYTQDRPSHDFEHAGTDFEEVEDLYKYLLHEMHHPSGIPSYGILVQEHFPGQEFMTTPMKKEVDRCVMAFEEAKKGKVVSMICSGDAGVYGMSGLMYEVGVNYPEVELEIIPGVTAATGGAALLGAPLIRDFCLISLSDLLTPWEKIEARLLAAAQADFVVCLYNPSSKKRSDYLQKACDLMMQYKSPETVCGIVSYIGRDGEHYEVMDLKTLRDTKVDMFTTVWVGNSQTKEINGKMVTPRGYRNV